MALGIIRKKQFNDEVEVPPFIPQENTIGNISRKKPLKKETEAEIFKRKTKEYELNEGDPMKKNMGYKI